MTVEAAIVLPLFIFCVIAVLSPLEWLDAHRKMQTEAEQVCEKMSLYAYMLGNQVEIADEEGNIIWNMEHREKIPFFHSLIKETTISVSAKRRGWIGLNGKLKSRNENFKINENEEEEEMVYVGMGMTRYHPYRDCHYLHNEYQEIPLEQAQLMKKDDGRRLSACASCAKKMNVGSIVYVTEYGRHYHSSKKCKAMVTYVRKVPLSKVSHLGECSACKKRGYGD